MFYFVIIGKGLWAYNCSQVVVRSKRAGKAFWTHCTLSYVCDLNPKQEVNVCVGGLGLAVNKVQLWTQLPWELCTTMEWRCLSREASCGGRETTHRFWTSAAHDFPFHVPEAKDKMWCVWHMTVTHFFIFLYNNVVISILLHTSLFTSLFCQDRFIEEESLREGCVHLKDSWPIRIRILSQLSVKSLPGGLFNLELHEKRLALRMTEPTPGLRRTVDFLLIHLASALTPLKITLSSWAISLVPC